MPSRFKRHRAPGDFPRDSLDLLYDRFRRDQDVRLRAVAKFRRSTAWRMTSLRQLSLYPFCCDPFSHHRDEGGRVPLADDAHHVIPLIIRLDLGLVMANLRSVCRSCHAEIEVLAGRDVRQAVAVFLQPAPDDLSTYRYEDATVGPRIG